MYKELKQILIITDIYQKKYKIILDNQSQEIIVNDELKYHFSSFENYISDLIRMIRTWPMNQDCIDYQTMIEITESNNTYTYYIENELPSNYDSFIELLIQII